MCGLSCSPKLHDVMDESLMIEIIDQAKEIGTFKHMAFSGGEAFLYPELLIKGSNYAKKLGFISTVATNGFWGLWSESKIDETLEAANLDDIHFSFDAYHSEYVSVEAMKNAVKACQRNGVNFTITAGETRGKYSVENFLKNIGDLKYKAPIRINAFYRVGRAENLQKEIFYPWHHDEKLCYDQKVMAIIPDGTVFPCCSPAVFGTCMKLGNIKEKSLAELLRDGNLISAYSLMHDLESFNELTEAAISKGVIDEDVENLSPCEICYWIFKTEDNVSKLSADIEKIFNKLMLKRFFKRINLT